MKTAKLSKDKSQALKLVNEEEMISFYAVIPQSAMMKLKRHLLNLKKHKSQREWLCECIESI